MSTIQKRFGKAVRRLRAQAGYSQEKFAAAAGIHRTHMGKIENGLIALSILKIEQIAIALELSPSELLAELEHED